MLSFGQRNNLLFNIKWAKPKSILDSNGNEKRILHCEKGIHLKEYNYYPAVEVRIPGTVSDFKISNTILDELTSEEQNTTFPVLPPFQYRIYYGNLHGKAYSFIHVISVIQSGGIVKKMTSFEYSYTLSNNLNSNHPAYKSSLKIASSSNSSVLSSGTWYKLRISTSGTYKIDSSFLRSLGINPESIDPNQIRIYGNGGGMLPQLNSAFRYDDLTENAIYSFDKNNNGVFNQQDFVLFYATGPDTWTYNKSQGLFNHTKNIYSDNSYYFLTIGPGNGLRIQNQSPPIGSPAQTITTFDERVFHELDNVNLLHSGRDWYGEVFDFETSQTISFNVPGIVSNTNVNINSYVMGASFYTNSFNVYLNNQFLGTHSLSPIINTTYADKGYNQNKLFTINSNIIGGSQLNFTYNYNKGASATAVGYLNYIELNLKRSLQLYNGIVNFRSITSSSNTPTEFVINNATNDLLIWDVTNHLLPENVNYTFSNSPSPTATFLSNTDTIREFVAFSFSAISNLPNPAYIGQVANQDLHAIGSLEEVPNLIIVTHPSFLSSAEKLANFRSSNDNLKVKVVTTDQVYNEFSSGAQDLVAIRDFARMAYLRSTPTDSLKYLLLFGDCSYDYKNRVSGNSNYIPVYESVESLHPIDSHSSDDFYGFFDPQEGNWYESGIDVIHTLEIGIGRLPVKSSSEADEVVSKLMNYSQNNESYGKWRNKLTFVADDGDDNLHLQGADTLATKVLTKFPVYNINKIYLDAFPQISTPGGETSPETNSAINEAIQKGTFIVNYTGHGGEQVWTQERILDLTQIVSWDNINQLPFFITATCDFGRYDDPSLVSGAETMILHSNGGSCGNICSTRPVYSNSNFELNDAIYNCIFTPVNGIMPRLGDVIEITKNNSISGINNRNYALLSDPSLMLGYPKDKIALTKINGKPISTADTIKALGKVTLEGEVRDNNGVIIPDFNGNIYVTIFDKPSVIKTFGTQGSTSTSFKLSNNLIYEGIASVTSGTFSLSFIVPKDISYQFDKGKVSMYCKKDGYLIDGGGYNNSIVIGGTDTSFKADNTPPQIKLFMNDESFVFGGLTPSNSLFLAKVSDENGINIAGQGIGHEITGVLDNSTQVIVMNDYYTTEKNSYQKGVVQYPFKNLPVGNHNIKFKCWDTYNNSSEAYLEFLVAETAKIALEHILNFPNPFSSHTTFHFDHNRAGDDVEVLIEIFSISGKLIKTLDTKLYSSTSHFSDLSWDGRDDFGDKIGKGVYVYKVKIKSLRDGSEVNKFQKLVLLN
jgi:hypothetical protein